MTTTMLPTREFAKVGDALPIPNLIGIQTVSYARFLQSEAGPRDREPKGLEALLREVFPIDTALLDFLFDVRVKLNTKAPYRIISGFRSLSTNATLAKRNDKVASRSLHMAGMAIDTSLPGIDTRRLRDAALSLRRGGVGYYQKSNFVHLDTGRVRQW